MTGLPTNWTADAAEAYTTQLRGLAHSMGLLDDEENAQEVCLRLLEVNNMPRSAYDSSRGSWRSYCYSVGRQALSKMRDRRRHLTAAQECRCESRKVVEARAARTLEDEQEAAYTKGRPFRGHATATA